MRLNHGETADSVKLNFLKKGYNVRDYEKDPRKRPVVTGLPKEQSKDITDHKLQKQSFLQTQNPDVFGTSQVFYPSRAH